MKLDALILENFRGFKGQHRIPFESLTVLVGRNDVGKSTVLEALSVFFNEGQIDFDPTDKNVHTAETKVRIGCEFSHLPAELVLDASAKTSFKDELLLNRAGKLEVHKVFDCSKANPKALHVIVANHPTGLEILFQKTHDDLQTLAEKSGADLSKIDQRSNVELRRAIREAKQVKTRAVDPASYRGLYAFHKYWGKKPAEPMRYLIQHLCPEGGLVVDPFLGSGIAALEAVQLKRRFVGMDINPAAVRLTRMLVSPPSARAVDEALAQVSALVKDAILESYTTAQKRPATHFVWRGGMMEMVWRTNGESRNRLELPSDEHDIALAESFASYQPKRLRAPRFFTNSRINSSASLTLKDLFTGRALRNIELLLGAIDDLPSAIQEPMRLSLTAAVGQMSKMVFAITGRGKTTGVSSERMEVGSWVIGYWRPEQHFEVNVWSCFERRVQKLIKAVAESESVHFAANPGSLSQVSSGDADHAILNGDCLALLPQLPDNSVDLVITDLSIPEETVRELRRQCSLGRKVIIESENLLQLLYRFQFARNYQCDYSQFLSIKWAVSSSPIEFPMSDVGLVPMVLEDHKANHYLLPIGPNLLLEGVFFHDLSKNSSRPIMRRMNLTEHEAEYRFDCICASAITEIICAKKLANIPEARDRAKANGTRFCKIPDAKRAISSGLADVGYGDFVFRIVPVDEYVKFVHSYMLPWNTPANLIA